MKEDNRYKVLFLTKWYPNRFDSLDGIFVVDHVKAIAQKHEIYVLFVLSDNKLKNPTKEIIRHKEGYTEHIIYFRCRKTGLKILDKVIAGIRYISVQYKAWRRIKKKWGKPNLIHIHVLLRNSLLALWLKKTSNIPYLITEHWSGYDPSNGYKIGWLKKMGIRTVIKNASIVTGVSEYLCTYLKKYDQKGNYKIISNAINESLFKPLNSKSNHQKKKIIHISSLSNYHKNFGNILKSIAEISKMRNDFEFHVIGKGEEEESQKELAKRLGVFNRTVFFHGHLTKTKTAKHISESNLMVLFSHYETQSCVVLESLMCGVPVIAPMLGGVKELVNKNNGILIRPNDKDELNKAICSILDNKISFHSEIIRKEALIYGYNSVGSKFSSLYHDILD